MIVTRRAARRSLATLAVAAVTVTVACSSGAGKSTVRVAPSPNSEAGKTGPQVLADATNALATVPVLHVVGSQLNPLSKLTVTIDMHAQADGGTATLRTDKGSVQMISIGRRTYFKGDVAGLFGPLFASLVGTSAKSPGGWFYSDDDSGEATGVKSIAKDLGELDNGVTVEPAVSKGTLDGTPVVIVHESDGSQMDVSAIGAPLPLKTVGSGRASVGFGGLAGATFGYDGTVVQLHAPAGAVPLPDPSLDPSALASLLPSAFPSGYPSGFPTDFPTDFPSEFASAFPTNFPSGIPSALASELRSFAATGAGNPSGIATPTPTP